MTAPQAINDETTRIIERFKVSAIMYDDGGALDRFIRGGKTIAQIYKQPSGECLVEIRSTPTRDAINCTTPNYREAMLIVFSTI